MKTIKHVDVKKRMYVNDLVKEMSQSGVFGAGRIAKAADIIEDMFKDKECKVFLGIAGAMVPGGMKNIIIDMLNSRYIDAIVTTGATLTHDLAEALGYKHYIGTAHADDSELHRKGFDRMYDSYMPNKVYESLEKFFNSILENMHKKINIKEFLWYIGKHVKSKDSILRVCYEKQIPIFCPGIADSGIGLMIWGNLVKGKKIDVNVFDDLKEIIDIAWTAKKRGFIYIGGGVPKNYIQQAMQFSKEGADYGVQITTDMPEYGGSSGAELREGISWGKLKENAKFVDVYCDATIALPLIYAAVKDRLKWF